MGYYRPPRYRRSSSTARSKRTLQHPSRRLRTGGRFCASVVSRRPLLRRFFSDAAGGGGSGDRNDYVSHCWDNFAHHLYLFVIPAFFGYPKYLKSFPPGSRNDWSLSWCRSIPFNASEDVRSWHDPMTTTNSANEGQGFTLQFNVQSLSKSRSMVRVTLSPLLCDNRSLTEIRAHTIHLYGICSDRSSPFYP